MSNPVSVAVVGAGVFGKFLVDELLLLKKRGKLSSVTVLTRTASQGNERNNEFQGHGANIIPVEYDNSSSLVTALSGIDVVISTIGVSGLQLQDQVAEAAKQAGVKVFVPSEFGVATDGIDEGGVLGKKFAIQRKLKELDLPYVLFYSGIWHDYILSIPVFGLDFKNETTTVYGIGDAHLSWTTRGDAVRYIGHIITSNSLEDLKWKTFRFEGDRLSWNQLVASWEAKSGKELTVNRITREELEERAKNPNDRLAAITLWWDKGNGTVGNEGELTNNLYPDWNPTKVLDVLFPNAGSV